MCEVERFAIQHREKLRQFVTKHSYDLSKVEDICQDTLLKAFKDYAQFQGKSAFSTWVYGIALNKCIISNRKKTPLFLDDFILQNIETQEHEQPDAVAELNFLVEKIQQKINTMPCELLEVLEMRELSEFSYKKIAELQNVEIGTVKSRVHRARNFLRGVL